jgi:hypothetical protein
MDEEQKKRWLYKVSTESRYRAYRRANHKPKNLESTGHPHLISAVDPNPPVVTNKPKARFSKVQREYLKHEYFSYAIDGKLQRQEARHAFEVRSEWSKDIKGGDKVQDRKAANRSAKRSAKNLAEYGYVVLSYDGPPETYDMEFNPNLYQPVLYVTPTMAAVEKGKEFMEEDGEPTDPEELRKRYEEFKATMWVNLAKAQKA